MQSHVPAAPQVCTGGALAMKEKEEWDGMLTPLLHCVLCMGWVSWCGLLVYLVDIVDFIKHSFGKKAHRDVLPSLLKELGSTYKLLRFSSQQTQSEALQAVVKQCRMTWFHFARCLLRSNPGRPFIFEIAKWTGGESCGWVLCRPGCIVLCLFRLSSLQSLFLISSRVCWEETLAVIGLSWPLRWECEEHLLMKSKECLM